ncbi:hypothetical protein H5410_028560, partial [Solanum commersonii]
ESPSTPICGSGETDESITPHIEVVASPVPQSREDLPCSPMLVLSGEKSQNSEVQSIVKPSGDLPAKEVKVVSRVVSSTMSKRLFDEDLSGKVPESNILAAATELVAVQSLASLRRDAQPTLLEQELRSPEKGVHDANFSTTGVSNLEGVNIVPDTDLNNEPGESVKERKRKRKGKMVTSYTKGD